YAAHVRAISARSHGIVLAAWAAAPSDPAVAALVAELDAQRLRGMTEAARSLAAKARAAGCLADGVTEDEIRDALWIFNSAQVYGMLLRDRGWSPKRYQAWLARGWTRLLLAPREANDSGLLRRRSLALIRFRPQSSRPRLGTGRRWGMAIQPSRRHAGPGCRARHRGGRSLRSAPGGGEPPQPWLPGPRRPGQPDR